MLYIHIGFHKTGSSTIQQMCVQNSRVLAQHGVLYARTGLKKAAHFNLTAELGRKVTFNPDKGGWADLRRELDDSPIPNALISSETLHVINPGQIAKVVEALAGLEVRVIAYIRSLPDIIVSTYGQQVKSGSLCTSFDEYFDALMVAREVGNGRATFLPGLERWADAFGWEEMRVRALDPADLVGGDLVTDFLSAIGLDRAALEGSLAAGSLELRNPALGWKTLELIAEAHRRSGGRRANRGISRRGDFRDIRRAASLIKRSGEAAAAELGLGADRAQYMTVAQWQRCRDIYRAELALLNERTGHQIPEPDWREPSERPFLPSVDAIDPALRQAFDAERQRQIRRLGDD